jgi:hypothetical protein
VNRIVFHLLAAAVVAAAFHPTPAGAADARVFLKNRMSPLYIQNMKIQFAQQRMGQEALILFYKEQRKYMTYGFDQIRKVEFTKFVGYRKQSPVFQVDLHLVETGSKMGLSLMPVAMLTGINRGVPWKYKFNLDQGYEDNAWNIQAIEFVREPGR